jgi:hypothetical protein
MNYTVETLINRTTFLLIIFLPGIFTSVGTLHQAPVRVLIIVQTFFSSNFFITTQDRIFESSQIWIWFAVTIPLGAVVLVAIYMLHLWHTNAFVRLKDHFFDRARNRPLTDLEEEIRV